MCHFSYTVGIGKKFSFCFLLFLFSLSSPQFQEIIEKNHCSWDPSKQFRKSEFFTKYFVCSDQNWFFDLKSKYTHKKISFLKNKQTTNFLKKINHSFFLDKIGSALNELNWSIIRFSPAPLKTFSQQKIMKGTMLWKLSGREDFFTCFFCQRFPAVNFHVYQLGGDQRGSPRCRQILFKIATFEFCNFTRICLIFKVGRR